MRPVGVAPRIDATARAAAHLLGHLLELRRLVAEHEHVRALGQLGVRPDGLPAELAASASARSRVESERARARPCRARAREAMFPAPMKPELHRRAAYDTSARVRTG